MKRYKYGLILALSVFSLAAKAQQQAVSGEQSSVAMLPVAAQAWTPLNASLLLPAAGNKNPLVLAQQTPPANPAPTAYLTPMSVAADSYYKQSFGYFCKREWELQQKMHVAIKVRLGSYQTAQNHEGK